MARLRVPWICICCVLSTAMLGASFATAEEEAKESQVSYARQIKPILSRSCYACHGPDETHREADLRLDVRESAVDYAIVPGDSQQSYLLDLIASADPDDRMPPADSALPQLSAEQVEMIRRWIDAGAEFEEHWAYVPPVAPQPPRGPDSAWPLNPIDHFIAAKLERAGLEPSAEADRRTLIRRLSFDLTGLPPKADEVDAFVADRSPGAYEKLVDRLLASPHYGERMAQSWLDVARYADTGGYHSDNHRDVWLYRDYLIGAFNDNKPFDEMTVEQLAGDLLPNATRAQRIASGYNRLLQTTEEGGAQPKEYTAKYAADRVRNAATAWMGATLGCAECHDHKFDPYSTRDFYAFAAFWADVQEKPVGRQEQTRVPTPEEAAELARLDGRVARLRGGRAEWTVLKPIEAESQGGATLEVLGDGGVRAGGKNPDNDVLTLAFEGNPAGVAALRIELLPDNSLPKKGPGRGPRGEFVLSELEVLCGDRRLRFDGATASAAQKGFAADAAVDGEVETGWGVLNQPGKAHHAVFDLAEIIGKDAPALKVVLRCEHDAGHGLGRFRISTSDFSRSQRDEIAERTREKSRLEAKIPTTLVSQSTAPRTVRVLGRGNWLDESGEEVAPAVPAFLGHLDVRGRPTRLDMARWLVSPEHPTVARVFVNRLWKQFFGRGIVQTGDDFGSQGRLPTHPELLDWLAVEFRDGGWDVKQLVRRMVTSRTYRQASDGRADVDREDPGNQWLARQGRFRLDAEFVRDNALATSGLLSTKIGGPSVKPYQPAGYWAHLNFPKRTYQHDQGENQYRRGLYTYWQRTFLHPSLLAFDAPSREECTVDRPRSNTPLQALVLLNDPTYVEAARVFAARVVRQGGDSPAERIAFAVHETLGRVPTPQEAAILAELVEQQHAEYKSDEEAACELLSVGASPLDEELDTAELAAWTSLARVLLNLHETITRY